jgi:hypothetical protein
VTFHALFQPRDACKGTVIAKAMAIKTSLGFSFTVYAAIGVDMKGMIEIHGLRLRGIEYHWKNDPSDNQGTNETYDKEDDTRHNGRQIQPWYKGAKGRQPSSLRRFFRGICWLFHIAKPLIYESSRLVDKGSTINAYLPVILPCCQGKKHENSLVRKP